MKKFQMAEWKKITIQFDNGFFRIAEVCLGVETPLMDN